MGCVLWRLIWVYTVCPCPFYRLRSVASDLGLHCLPMSLSWVAFCGVWSWSTLFTNVPFMGCILWRLIWVYTVWPCPFYGLRSVASDLGLHCLPMFRLWLRSVASDLGLQCLPMSLLWAAFCGVWSGSTLFAHVPFMGCVLWRLIWVYTVCQFLFYGLHSVASDLGLHCLPMSLLWVASCGVISGSTLFAHIPFMGCILWRLIWIYTVCPCPFYGLRSAASYLGLHCLPMSLLWVAFCGVWSGSTLFAHVPFMGCVLWRLIWVYTVCPCPFYGLHSVRSDLGLHCLPMSLLWVAFCGVWSGSTLFANVPFMGCILWRLIWVYTVCPCPFYGLHSVASDLGLHCLPMSLLWVAFCGVISGSTLFAHVPFMGRILWRLIWVYTVCPCPFYGFRSVASDLGLHCLPMSLLRVAFCGVWSGSTLFAHVPFMGCILWRLIWVYTFCPCPFMGCVLWRLIWIYTVCPCPFYGLRSVASDLGLHCLAMSFLWDARLIWIMGIGIIFRGIDFVKIICLFPEKGTWKERIRYPLGASVIP